MQLCDTLLRLADAGFYRPVWSVQILDEFESSVIRRGMPEDEIRRRRRTMEAVFPDAMEVNGQRYLTVVPDSVDPKDRHVVATAVASHADVIVTANIKDVAPDSLYEELGIAVQLPDEFLAHQVGLNDGLAVGILREQAAALQHPPMTFEELLGSLQKNYPMFVSAVRNAR